MKQNYSEICPFIDFFNWHRDKNICLSSSLKIRAADRAEDALIQDQSLTKTKTNCAVENLILGDDKEMMEQFMIEGTFVNRYKNESKVKLAQLARNRA